MSAPADRYSHPNPNVKEEAENGKASIPRPPEPLQSPLLFSLWTLLPPVLACPLTLTQYQLVQEYFETMLGIYEDGVLLGPSLGFNGIRCEIDQLTVY
jgi:hypothetical protein